PLAADRLPIRVREIGPAPSRAVLRYARPGGTPTDVPGFGRGHRRSAGALQRAKPESTQLGEYLPPSRLPPIEPRQPRRYVNALRTRLPPGLIAQRAGGSRDYQ